MEKSKNYNFNLPNSENDEIADINDISDNFRIIDEIMNETDQTFEPTSTKAASGKAVNEAISGIQPIDENTEFIFDGGDVDGGVSVDIVVDTVLSKTSNNPIANKPVAIKFSEILGAIDTLKNMVHIVESGTSGIWSYRKWSDGTAECWGKDYSVVDLTLSATTSAGTNCYTNKDAIILTLPDSLFIDTPSATVGIVRVTSWLPFVACMRTLTKDSIELRYFMFTASTSEFIRNETGEFEPTCLHLIGRWK